MSRQKQTLAFEPDAEFIGWLYPRQAGPIALYNITLKDHPSFGSTVTDKTLRRLNLNIPNTPPPKGKSDPVLTCKK
jgi:hypothetical protein